jgi:hypothetical protein
MPSKAVPPDTAARLLAAQATLTAVPEWTRRAACARLAIDPRAFDPDWTDPQRNGFKSGLHAPAEQDRREELAEAATRICTTYCPVQVQCMAAGSVRREWGIWGGMTRVTVPPSRISRPRKQPAA